MLNARSVKQLNDELKEFNSIFDKICLDFKVGEIEKDSPVYSVAFYVYQLGLDSKKIDKDNKLVAIN